MTQRKHKSRYQITIVERTFERQIVGHEWLKGGDPGNPEAFAYSPEIEKIIPVERRIFEQDVESLNLEDVIKAINKMNP